MTYINTKNKVDNKVKLTSMYITKLIGQRIYSAKKNAQGYWNEILWIGCQSSRIRAPLSFKKQKKTYMYINIMKFILI